MHGIPFRFKSCTECSDDFKPEVLCLVLILTHRFLQYPRHKILHKINSVLVDCIPTVMLCIDQMETKQDGSEIATKINDKIKAGGKRIAKQHNWGKK